MARVARPIRRRKRPGDQAADHHVPGRARRLRVGPLGAPALVVVHPRRRTIGRRAHTPAAAGSSPAGPGSPGAAASSPAGPGPPAAAPRPVRHRALAAASSRSWAPPGRREPRGRPGACPHAGVAAGCAHPGAWAGAAGAAGGVAGCWAGAPQAGAGGSPQGGAGCPDDGPLPGFWDSDTWTSSHAAFDGFDSSKPRRKRKRRQGRFGEFAPGPVRSVRVRDSPTASARRRTPGGAP